MQRIIGYWSTRVLFLSLGIVLVADTSSPSWAGRRSIEQCQEAAAGMRPLPPSCTEWRVKTIHIHTDKQGQPTCKSRRVQYLCMSPNGDKWLEGRDEFIPLGAGDVFNSNSEDDPKNETPSQSGPVPSGRSWLDQALFPDAGATPVLKGGVEERRRQDRPPPPQYPEYPQYTPPVSPSKPKPAKKPPVVKGKIQKDDQKNKQTVGVKKGSFVVPVVDNGKEMPVPVSVQIHNGHKNGDHIARPITKGPESKYFTYIEGYVRRNAYGPGKDAFEITKLTNKRGEIEPIYFPVPIK